MDAPGPVKSLSELIGNIYDCILDPGMWPSVLAEICTDFGFASAILAVVRLPGLEVACLAYTGIAPEMVAMAMTMAPEITQLWGGLERIKQFPLDEPIVHSQAIVRASVLDNRYLREWGEPQGYLDAVAINLANDGSMIANLGMNRHRSAGFLTEAWIVDGLRTLAPHIGRALAISNLFDMKAIEAATFASVLDASTFGVFLVDANLAIVHANAVAGRMLTERDPVQSTRGTLSVGQNASNAALRRAVAQAASNDVSIGQGGIGIPARRSDGSARVLHVLPLNRGAMRRGLAQRAVAAVFVAPALGAAPLPKDALALLYDLTPAEARIFELIVAGQTQREMSNTLGVAGSTVKSHVLSLFNKTGCSRQVDLVRLANAMSPPI
ncbi:MAG: helix-turn-helix transcriptional regulator [Bauldia sp.]